MTYGLGDEQLTFKDGGLMDMATTTIRMGIAAKAIKESILAMMDRCPKTYESYLRQYAECRNVANMLKYGDFAPGEPLPIMPEWPSLKGVKFDEEEEKCLVVQIDFIYKNIARIAEGLWERGMDYPTPKIISYTLGCNFFAIKDNYNRLLVLLDGTERMMQPFGGFQPEMFPHEIQYYRIRNKWKWIRRFLPTLTFQPEDLVYDDKEEKGRL